MRNLKQIALLTVLSFLTGLLSLAPGEGTGEDPLVYGPTLVRAYRNGNQNFYPGQTNYIAFNVESIDRGHNFDPSEGSFQVPQNGYYRIMACARINTPNFSQGDTVDLSIEITNSWSEWTAFTRTPVNTSEVHACVKDIVSLTQYSLVKIGINATGSGTRSIIGSGNYSTFLTIEKIEVEY